MALIDAPLETPMRASDSIKNEHETQINTSLHDEILFWFYERLRSAKNPAAIFNLAEKYRYLKHDVQIEMPLYKTGYKNNGSVAGFVDIAAIGTFESYENFTVDKWRYERETGPKAELIGIDPKDPSSVVLRGIYEMQFVHCFEIKSSVNVGETIRQITYYRQFSSDARWSVVAPPFPQSQILVEQGIRFIPYET
jgi:hypothetical protein